jgi:hypothetical protein
LLAASASEMWITWSAMARLYRHSARSGSASNWCSGHQVRNIDFCAADCSQEASSTDVSHLHPVRSTAKNPQRLNHLPGRQEPLPTVPDSPHRQLGNRPSDSAQHRTANRTRITARIGQQIRVGIGQRNLPQLPTHLWAGMNPRTTSPTRPKINTLYSP